MSTEEKQIQELKKEIDKLQRAVASLWMHNNSRYSSLKTFSETEYGRDIPFLLNLDLESMKDVKDNKYYPSLFESQLNEDDSNKKSVSSNKTEQQFKKELDDMGSLPFYEFDVKDLRTGKKDNMICIILISEGKFILQREALNKEEEEGDKGTRSEIYINPDQDLNWHLQALWDKAIKDLKNSEFYELIQK
ncbi:hypothetical protein LCM02_12395 [Lutimonas saemankumensis]|uniref:hypothetical protein n=1 Tax=Lutimonas saemankumensis TaxID=483016 RepID=UPI001CD39FD8|nr:hypothetical protein [Lutimonas saemankumensis]MCA0933254.1 hypothetical protein [Lutimonas saemankumensis]